MTEHFARQLTGSKCGPKNCAAASGAMAVMFALGINGISADEFRERSGVSCVPGEHSKSGGLFISDVERTAATYGVSIDYGRDKPGDPPKRWSESEAHQYLSGGFVGIFLGDYDQMGSDSAQPSYKGDHSSLAHDYSEETDTVCFHDALRTKPVRVTWARVMKYWRKPGSPVLGLAGFVAIKEEDVDIYAVPGSQSAEAPAKTPFYAIPGGKAVGTTAAARRFQLVGQERLVSPTHYLVDGGTDGLMRWVRKAALSGFRDDVVVAAAAAAKKAHDDTKAAAIKAVETI